MVLTRNQILKHIRDKEIVFSPEIDRFQLQPHAVDLRLGNTFHLPKTWELTQKGRIAVSVDPAEKLEKNNYDIIELANGQYFEVLPGEFVVGVTLERIDFRVPDLMAVLYPRSSINRRGLSIGMTGIVDAFYSGTLMIPIMNMTVSQVIRIYPGERVCQLVFERLDQSLDKKEAQLHGVSKAKYIDRKNGEIYTRPDKEEEIDMITKGKLSVLKNKYKLL